MCASHRRIAEGIKRFSRPHHMLAMTASSGGDPGVVEHRQAIFLIHRCLRSSVAGRLMSRWAEKVVLLDCPDNVVTPPGAAWCRAVPKTDYTGRKSMKNLVMPMLLGVSLLMTSAGFALAVDVHRVTGAQGQPNQTIGTTQTGSVTPGHAATSPGSAFNPNGNADTRYAGTQS